MSRNIARAFISIFGSKIGVLAIGIITTPIIVRFLGSGGYGDYALLLSIFGLLTVVTESGTFNGIRKYIAEEKDATDWENRVFGFYFRISILITGGTAVVVGIFGQTNFARNVFAPEFRVYFLILAGYLFVHQFYSLGRGVLMGFGLEHYSEPIKIINKLTYVLTAIPLLYFGFGVIGVLFAQILASVTVGLLAFWLIKNNISFKSIYEPTSGVISRSQLLSFNFYSVLLAFLTVSLYNVDVLLLQPIVGSSEAGYYKAALVVAEFLWMVPVAIQYALVQSTSEMWSKGQEKKVTDIAARSTRLNLSLVLIMLIGLVALSDTFVPLYFGSDFEPAIEPLLLLLPGVLGLALSKPIWAIGQGKGEIRALVVATGLAAVLNLVLNLILIPRYGMSGAAVATSIGYGSMFVLHTWTAFRIGFNPIADLRVIRITGAGLGVTPVVFGLTVILPPLVALVVVPPIGFIIYTTLSLRLNVIDEWEVSQIQKKVPAKIRPIFVYIRYLGGYSRVSSS